MTFSSVVASLTSTRIFVICGLTCGALFPATLFAQRPVIVSDTINAAHRIAWQMLGHESIDAQVKREKELVASWEYRDWAFRTGAIRGHQPNRPTSSVSCFPTAEAFTDTDLILLKQLKSLQCLHLNDAKITNSGLVHIGQLKSLMYLNLSGTKVSGAGMGHLEGLKRLKRLYIGDTNVSEQSIEKLQKALPKCEIIAPRTI